MKRVFFWIGVVTAVVLVALVLWVGPETVSAPGEDVGAASATAASEISPAQDLTATMEHIRMPDPTATMEHVRTPDPTATTGAVLAQDPAATQETVPPPDPTTTLETVPAPKQSFLPSLSKQPTPTPSGAIPVPFYGMVFPSQDQLGLMKELGVEVVHQRFDHDETPGNWVAQLDEAQRHDLRVIAWLWPEGWRWNGSAWQIDDQARSFVRIVAGHPATLAVYMLHEPYWQGCWGCGYTTAQQQLLYDAIKAIADVPIYSEVGGVAFWTAQGADTVFDERVCDYCGNWYYPFVDGKYERDILVQKLKEDVAVTRERAPTSKIIWGLQAFAQGSSGHYMPNAEQMYDLAAVVFAAGVDGAAWYPWTFSEQYDDFLANHPELYDTVRRVYDEIVVPRRQSVE
jgi:hypothetical protein